MIMIVMLMKIFMIVMIFYKAHIGDYKESKLSGKDDLDSKLEEEIIFKIYVLVNRQNHQHHDQNDNLQRG